MTKIEDEGGADLRAAPSFEVKRKPSYTSMDFQNNENSRIPNAYVIKKSRYMKRENRDLRLFLSPCNDDYLVLKSDVDLIARLEKEFVLVEVFDSLAEEAPKVRELTTWKIWKQNELKENTNKLLQISISTSRLKFFV